MRKPRPQDFAPEYQRSKSPKPEEVDISGAVAIKPKKMDSIQLPNKNNDLLEKGNLLPGRSTDRTPDRSNDRAENQQQSNPKRITRRYSFEAYDDQIQEIKEISIQAAIDGKSIPISEMIRDAIDVYLKERREKLTSIERSTDRSNDRKKRPI